MVAGSPTPISNKHIAMANVDLQERLFKEGVTLVYDEDGDTLLITIGESVAAITKQMVDGIYIRVEPTTYKIVGCTILAFASDLLAKNKLIRKAFPNALETLKASGGTITLVGEKAERTKPLFEGALSR